MNRFLWKNLKKAKMAAVIRLRKYWEKNQFWSYRERFRFSKALMLEAEILETLETLVFQPYIVPWLFVTFMRPETPMKRLVTLEGNFHAVYGQRSKTYAKPRSQ